jgi:hypothetical protein
VADWMLELLAGGVPRQYASRPGIPLKVQQHGCWHAPTGSSAQQKISGPGSGQGGGGGPAGSGSGSGSGSGPSEMGAVSSVAKQESPYRTATTQNIREPSHRTFEGLFSWWLVLLTERLVFELARRVRLHTAAAGPVDSKPRPDGHTLEGFRPDLARCPLCTFDTMYMM